MTALQIAPLFDLSDDKYQHYFLNLILMVLSTQSKNEENI